jgi:V/A-type H+/Na+-transporting ATPase subunit E
MALDGVVRDIVESARREADALIQSAEEERRSTLGTADEKIAKMRRAKERELEEALKRLRRQEISSAELEAKKIVLKKKKEIFDLTFEQTLRELTAMPSTDKKRIYWKSIDSARKVLPTPRVYCPRGEGELLTGVAGLSEVVEEDMGAGLILENADGSMRLDYRFRTILESIWEQELKQISVLLFG